MDSLHVPYTESIVFAAEYLARACREYARKVIKENNYHFNFEEYLILDTIVSNPGLIQMDIAKKLLMQRSYLCKLLNKLEENSYVRREKTIKGKRQIVLSVFITDKGEKEYRKMQSSFIEIIIKDSVFEKDKMKEITDELFRMSNKMVDTFNLKL